MPEVPGDQCQDAEEGRGGTKHHAQILPFLAFVMHSGKRNSAVVGCLMSSDTLDLMATSTVGQQIKNIQVDEIYIVHRFGVLYVVWLGD